MTLSREPVRLEKAQSAESSPGPLVARPAESAGVAGVVGTLVAYAFGVHDAQTILALATGIGLLPPAVTFLVSNGGVRGVVRRLWRGR